MPDFSVIAQSPEVRALVQENLLERAFHDALFPRLLFRGEATPVLYPGNVGDSQVFTGAGLIRPNLRPIRPGDDPTPKSYKNEQWTATLNQYADTIDTPMPTSMVAIANLFLRNAQQLGLQAAQSLNRMVRDRMYNAAESGWTVADGAQAAVTSLRVMRLNGFTRARNPNLPNGSQVRFELVSTNNPLTIQVFDGSVYNERSVIGFTSDEAGDEIGPGTLLVSAAVTASDRGPVLSYDRTALVRVGGGDSVGAIGPNDTPKLNDMRAAVARLRTANVSTHADSYYHCHFDPDFEAALFADPEMQRMNTSLPDGYMYKEFALGELLGIMFFRNTECPVPETVEGAGLEFTLNDPFAGELYSNGASTGTIVHRALLTGQGGIYEYYSDLSALLTDAGVTGKIGEPSITNNGIEVYSDRIQLVIRAPLNRLQDQVATTWKIIADWPVRTDAATGGLPRYKRFIEVQAAV